MRASIIWALAALLAVVAMSVFLMVDPHRRQDRREHNQLMEGTASQYAELVAALERLSKEVQDLRMQLRQTGAAIPAVESRITNPAGFERPRGGVDQSPGAGERLEVSPSTAQFVRSKLVERPEPEKRKLLDELVALTYDDQARSLWFLTYAEVLDRYGAPDGIASPTDGSIEFNYTVKNSLLHVRFRHGVVIGVWYEQH